MTAGRTIQNLALIGFMGAGKSTVGRMVARQLAMEFVDTDDVIESRAGLRIADIFARDGESKFRLMEREVVRDLLEGQGRVIATGGGLVCQPGNLELLKSRSLVICLWASHDTIWERVRHQTHRPLLRVAEPREAIDRLLTAREPFYRQADVLVNSGLRSLREVAAQVAHHYSAARRRQEEG